MTNAITGPTSNETSRGTSLGTGGFTRFRPPHAHSAQQLLEHLRVTPAMPGRIDGGLCEPNEGGLLCMSELRLWSV